MYYIGLDVHKKTISYCVKGDCTKWDIFGSCWPAVMRSARVSVLCYK